MSKYIIQNGRVVLNPNFNAPNASSPQQPSVANPQRATLYASSVQDVNQLADVSQSSLAPSTLNVVTSVQDPNYVNRFGSGGQIDGGELLEQVSTVSSHYNAPIGLFNKLIGLQGFAINIKVDDSGSMGSICANGVSRWGNVEQRLVAFMNMLKLVPTGPITLSFLDRQDIITVNRQGQTPDQFYSNACQVIQRAFQTHPRGGTPIYASVYQMMHSVQNRPTAHYLLTDGEPSDSRYTKEQEIQMTKDLLLNRWNARQNPFTFLCCSDNPADTLWMHEIEEIACAPGNLGYVSALQNFRAEQVEVLNDQGCVFPYSHSMWLLCNLTAALNPNDLDALDEHAPLSKPTYDSILGHVTTLPDYETYFNCHPNANWIFAEDYHLFLSTAISSQIPAVNFFDTRLAQELNRDINNRDDTSEPRAIARTEDALLQQFRRQRPDVLRRARQDYWYNHSWRMELQQMQWALQHGCPRQDIWGDFVAAANIGGPWTNYVLACRQQRGSTSNAQSGYGQQQGNGQPGQQAQGTFYPYSNPAYYRGSMPTNYSSSCCSVL